MARIDESFTSVPELALALVGMSVLRQSNGRIEGMSPAAVRIIRPRSE